MYSNINIIPSDFLDEQQEAGYFKNNIPVLATISEQPAFFAKIPQGLASSTGSISAWELIPITFDTDKNPVEGTAIPLTVSGNLGAAGGYITCTNKYNTQFNLSGLHQFKITYTNGSIYKSKQLLNFSGATSFFTSVTFDSTITTFDITYITMDQTI